MGRGDLTHTSSPPTPYHGPAVHSPQQTSSCLSGLFVSTWVMMTLLIISACSPSEVRSLQLTSTRGGVIYHPFKEALGFVLSTRPRPTHQRPILSSPNLIDPRSPHTPHTPHSSHSPHSPHSPYSSQVRHLSRMFFSSSQEDDSGGDRVEVTQLKKGDTITKEGVAYKILSIFSVNVARGAAFYRSRVLNYSTNTEQDMNFRGGDKLYVAKVDERRAMFSYPDDTEKMLVFQDCEDWEEVRVPFTVATDIFDLLQVGMECRVRIYKGLGIGVTIPAASVYTVKSLC
eukprot:GHVN01091517.1.p1 GENE.GHVN01091517.1~~GHVN01091517.1.p1  ORF type:complete len:286 (+),score=91.97 GHVN01091517.1:89-946(+)